ncbi:MAG: LruC domain-containing protein [Bacteroidota bacterium]
MKKITLIIIIAFLFISSLMSQTTRYVDPSGVYAGHTPCYATIQAAVTTAIAGDIIQVNPGNYTGNISINKNNITLISRDGAATTFIYGNDLGSYTGTIFLPGGGSGIKIGSMGHGFTITGLNGSLALDKASIYFQGTQTNITVEDNTLQAAGGMCLMGESNANVTNITINHNHFTGKTFYGSAPHSGSSDTNSARQAVYFGGVSSGASPTMNFTFTNNQISTICGSGSNGNTLVDLDISGTNIITGNTFDGTIGTSSSYYALLMRATFTSNTIQNNIFNGTYPYAFNSSNTVNATNNYWGTSKGPKVASNACIGTYSISSNVTYEPWYSDATLTTLVYKLVAYNVSGTTSICNGSNANIALSGTQNGSNYQYQLYVGGSTTVGSPISGTGSAITAPASSAGTYTIKATNTINSCVLAMTSSAVITLKARPTANITGGTSSSVTVALTGATPWNGTLSDGTTFSATTSPKTITVSPTGTTTYTVATLTDANSCPTIAGDLTGSYTITMKAASPTFTPTAGTYNTPQSVTLSSTTSGATIRYTTDGSTPTETNGTIYTTAVNISTSTTLKAIAYKTGMTDSDVSSSAYTIQFLPCADPTFSVLAGTYNISQSVTISTTTSDASIRYTTDGSDPSDVNGTLYSAPISISQNTTLKAIAYKQYMLNSNVVSGIYNIKCATPAFNLPAGSYTVQQSLAINLSTTSTGATIKYTTDGSTPDANNGIVYSAPILINSNTNFKVIVIKTGLVNSDISTANYTILIDTDGDGVIDSEDAYPNDSTRAFNNYFPAENKGSLAFEDSWPSKGDYDMNDVVVDYQFKNITNAHNQLVETFASFTLKASGASYNNGFGFQLATNDIPSSAIQVTGSSIKESFLMLNANGTEQGQDKSTLIVFDNAYDVLQYPGSGLGFNTSPDAPYVTPVTITLHIIYTPYTYTEQQLDIAHFNPFIIVNKVRGKEVHLPDYAPTALVNTAYFGTGDDKSVPAQGRYYKTANNLPWALNMYNGFNYPNEKAEITKAYLHFIDWVLSNGTSYTDWYTNTATGYRNNANIYSKNKK